MTYIYGIYHREKNILLYVGSTDDYIRRWKEHSKALNKGKHSNKTLQKYFNENGLSPEDLEFKVLYSLDTKNSLIRFSLEMLTISCSKPLCNLRCVISQGRNRIVFARCDKDIAKKLIDVIINV